MSALALFFYAPKPQRPTLNYSAMAEKQQVLSSWSCTSSLGFCDHQIGTRSINCGQIAKISIFAQKSAEGEENKVSTTFSVYVQVFVAKCKVAKNLTQLDKVVFLHMHQPKWPKMMNLGRNLLNGCKRGFNGFPCFSFK